VVSRLVIFREQMLHRYIELTRRELKIGRGPQNDVVLEDPDKVVSRFHAELRPEGDDYVLIDLNSQNGTWVDAERVDRIVLQAGVPVAIGPYRLVYEQVSDRG
jgi:pSer/pThr/pTyr-binding forkhead associated (FHA) protein